MTPKQQRFVDEYLISLNATQAAIRAGYSQNMAKQIGYENLTKPYIAEAIAARRAQEAEKALVTREMVIEGLLREAHDTSKNSSQAARVSALSWLGKHLEMFTDKVSGTVGHYQAKEIPVDQRDPIPRVALTNGSAKPRHT